MMLKMKYGLLMLSLTIFFSDMQAQKKNPWKKGILVDEFIYDTAPFPECHAATIAETPAGLVAAFFGGTKERNPDVEIWVCRQENGHWTKPVSVANGIMNDTLRYPTWNPVLYQVPNGGLLLFYKIGPSPSTWKGWMKTSSDNGKTWSQAKSLSDFGGSIGPVKNKPVLLSNGTLLAPSSTEGDGWKIHFEASNDFGKTWKRIGPINDGKTTNAIQPSILIYKDGKLQILARSKERALIQSWSSDNGETWSPLTKTNLPNNNSGTDAVTLKDGRQLLVYNHVLPPADAKNGKGARTPLNLSWSKDGKTWYAAAILEDSPISQYSYPSIIQSSDGMVHVVYTWRRQKIKYVKIDPSKLIGKKIVDGKWPDRKGYKAPQAAKASDD
jgi:predicted neuraminidase